MAGGSKPFEIYSWLVNNWNSPPIIFRGHSNYIYRLRFSEDSKFLLSSSADKTSILWNIDKKLPQQIYKGHSQNVYGCAISIKSNRVATIGGDELIIVYDQQSAQILHQWKGHSCEYGGSSINYMQNGQLIIHSFKEVIKNQILKKQQYLNDQFVSGGYDGKIKLWDANNYELLREFISHSKNWVWSISISLNQEQFGSICNDYTLKIWDVKQTKPLLTLPNENNGAPGSEIQLMFLQIIHFQIDLLKIEFKSTIILKENQFIIATSIQSVKIWKLS